jgi:hypothetical protein
LDGLSGSQNKDTPDEGDERQAKTHDEAENQGLSIDRLQAGDPSISICLASKAPKTPGRRPEETRLDSLKQQRSNRQDAD